MWEVRKYTYPMDGCEVLLKGSYKDCKAFYDNLPPAERERCSVATEGELW